jgi:hypothetical protein
MAENTTNSNSSDATTNTTTVTSGRGSESTLQSGSAPKDVKTAPAALDTVSLPYPHQALTNVSATEGTVYKDLISEVYAEHEAKLKEGLGTYKPSPEMEAARADAQARLAVELRASLEAQRSMVVPDSKGSVKVKLSQNHTHNGVVYAANDEVLVDEASAKFIEDAKIGKRV